MSRDEWSETNLEDAEAERQAAISIAVTLRTGAVLVAAARRRLLQPEEVQQALEILEHERYLDSRAVEDILGLLSDL